MYPYQLAGSRATPYPGPLSPPRPYYQYGVDAAATGQVLRPFAHPRGRVSINGGRLPSIRSRNAGLSGPWGSPWQQAPDGRWHR